MVTMPYVPYIVSGVESILLWCHMAVCSLYIKLCTLVWRERSWCTLLWTYPMSSARAIGANRDIWWQRWDCCDVNTACNPFQT